MHQRYLALDAYRGAVMILLVSGGFGQFKHRPWEGLGLWDLILPAFFFIVGRRCPLPSRAGPDRASGGMPAYGRSS